MLSTGDYQFHSHRIDDAYDHRAKDDAKGNDDEQFETTHLPPLRPQSIVVVVMVVQALVGVVSSPIAVEQVMVVIFMPVVSRRFPGAPMNVGILGHQV